MSIGRKEIIMKKEFNGIVKENPYGDWDDVDKGLYIGTDNIEDIIDDLIRTYKNKKVKLKLNIEEISNSDCENYINEGMRAIIGEIEQK